MKSEIEQTKQNELINKEAKVLNKKAIFKDIIVSLAIAFLVSAFSILLYQLQIVKTKEFNPIEITYSEGKTIMFSKTFMFAALFISIFVILLNIGILLLVRPSSKKPNIGKKGKNIYFLSILSLFGILAFLVISIFLTTLEISNSTSLFIASFLVCIYETLIYKLYLEEKTYSNHLFWEIFRFAIVGLVAAVFDFTLCFIFQFLIFKGGKQWYVSGISTMMGFIVGVIINYLMSTYMVYKNTRSNVSKTPKGMALFLILAIIGLFLGIGIQYILYDLLNLKVGISIFSYPVCFVLRTLIVMVYNYISRKLIIYK